MFIKFENDPEDLGSLDFMQPQCETWDLFKSWELTDEVISILNEHNINNFVVLKKIEIDDVENLFNTLDKKYFSERIKFKAGLREWRTQNHIPFINNQDTMFGTNRILDWLEKISDDLQIVKSKDIPSHSSSENNECSNLNAVLKQTVRGQLVLIYQQTHGHLDTKHQKLLTHCIVDSYISTSRKMSYGDMKKWADAICKEFPKENPETYFLSRKGKKNPSGKLFSRWNGSKPGVLSNMETTTVLSKEENLNEIIMEKKNWLLHNCTPWDQVKTYWKDTFVLRKTNKGSLTNLLLEWPRYNDGNGFELVDIDFSELHPDKGHNIFLKLESFYEKIIPVLQQEVKDQGSRELFLAKLDVPQVSIDSKFCLVLLLLHAILQPQRTNKKYKATISEAQDNFLIHAATFSDMELQINKKINACIAKQEKLLPGIVVVGSDITNLTEFYIFCDGLKWRCCSFMKCIDIIIKLSFVFELGYAHTSKQVWSFLEQYFFEIKSENFSSVSNLLSKLKT